MAIEVVDTFPGNVVKALGESMQRIDPHTDPDRRDGLRVEYRPIRDTDTTETVSVVQGTWTGDMDSLEINGARQLEPTVQIYSVTLEALVVDMDEERGIETHSALSARVRHMLYRDQELHVKLRGLNVPLDDYLERFVSWELSPQRYFNNLIDNSFVFLSDVEFRFKTEIARV